MLALLCLESHLFSKFCAIGSKIPIPLRDYFGMPASPFVTFDDLWKLLESDYRTKDNFLALNVNIKCVLSNNAWLIHGGEKRFTLF